MKYTDTGMQLVIYLRKTWLVASPHGEPMSNPQPIDGDFLIEEQIMPDYENVITDWALPPVQHNSLPKNGNPKP